MTFDFVTRKRIFTLAGKLVLIIASVILIRSLVMRNSYEIALSSGFLFLMLIIGVTGMWKSRKLKTLEPAWKPPFPMTACANNDCAEGAQTQITGLEASIPLFFRLHFIVRGSFFPSGSEAGCPVLIETSVPRGGTSARLALDFPMSGVFQGEGYCRLRDTFGLFSFFCGQPQSQTVKIRCAPCFGKNIRINAQSGAEDKRNKPSTDEERYYMREYTPGDRLRDINWKSSDRIDTLITRISTDTQEKISRIEVHFRNFYQRAKTGGKKEKGASLEALWLLDRAKARLTYFLRSVKEQNTSFIFDVRTAQGNWEIEDDEDLDAFLEELAGFSLLPPKIENALSSGAGDLYVFSTACDIGLPAFLLACNPRPVTLFLSQPAERRAENKEQVTKGNKQIEAVKFETEKLSMGDFTSKGCFAQARWFVDGKVNPLGVNSGRMEINYAGINL